MISVVSGVQKYRTNPLYLALLYISHSFSFRQTHLASSCYYLIQSINSLSVSTFSSLSNQMSPLSLSLLMKLLSYLPNFSRRYYKHLTITASQSCLENINSVTSCNKHFFGSKTTEKNVFKSLCISTTLGFKMLFSYLNKVLFMDSRISKFH